MKLGSNLDLNKVVRNLGQKMLLVPHLDMEIGRGEFEWEFSYEPKCSDDAWHPSGHCTPTLRELYHIATGDVAERPIGAPLRKTFMVGHFWHQYVQWIVEKKLGWASGDEIERRGLRIWGSREATPPADLSLLTAEEERIWNGKVTEPTPYHWARGQGDIAPIHIPGESPMAVDFKTMNARMFQTGPSPDYAGKWECQGNCYMDFFDLDRILFVGICKDSPHDMKEWIFERNQPLIDAIYLKWRLVSQCVTEGVVPPEDEEIELPLKGMVLA